jgi:hypothetical protein
MARERGYSVDIADSVALQAQRTQSQKSGVQESRVAGDACRRAVTGAGETAGAV